MNLVFNNEANRPGEPDSEGRPVPVNIESRAEVSPSRVLQCTDPARGEIFHELTCAGPEEVDRAVNAATLAWAMWRGTDIKERLVGLKRLAGLIREQAPIIAELIAREMGRPASEAMALEILPALDYLNYLAVHAEDAYIGRPIQPRHVFNTHKRVHYLYEPYGLIAVVTPYSVPFAIPLAQVAAALAMGNAVLLKPSELTPLCGMKIGELCRQAGLPEGLVQVLPMKKEDALFLVSHPGVDKIFVTGSPETGRQVMAIAGCIPKPVVLSLGSKNPAVVANDADLERTARGVVWGSMVSSGQHCDAIERVYVTEAIASRFVEKVLAEVDKLVTGNPMDATVDLGPLISAWRRDHIHSQVTDAVAKGGQLLRGGHLPDEPGFFYPPTVVLNPPPDCRLMREETLGPVIPITVVDSLERAIFLANETDFALSASGWTGSSEKAERLMVGLQAGVVTINDVLWAPSEPAASRAGYRMSGLGQLQGIEGLQEMCRRRLVAYDSNASRGPLFSFPYDREQEQLVKGAMDLLHASTLPKRIRGLMRLLTLKRFRTRVPGRLLLLRSKRRKK